jgi:hypothetical protein
MKSGVRWLIGLAVVVGAVMLTLPLGSNRAQPAPVAWATRVGTIAEKKITEASGVAASRRFDGIFWTHNDGDDGTLFAIHRDGSLVAKARIDAKVHDWEDIAADADGNLYIADTGNNQSDRKHVNVYRLREPDPANLAKEIAIEETW